MQIGGDVPRAADFVNQALDDGKAGHVTRPDGFGADESLFLCQREGFLGLMGVQCERFFAQHMLAVLQAQHHLLEMQRMRRADVHQIHLFVLRHFLVAAVCFFKTFLFGKGFGLLQIPGGGCVQVNVFSVCLHHAKRAGHLGRDMSAAQYSDIEHWLILRVFSYCNTGGCFPQCFT